MNATQFKTIRNSLSQKYFLHLESNPTGKHIKDIEYNKRKYELHCTDVLTQNNNVYKFYNLPYKRDSLQTQSVYLITLNDRVIYAYECNIFAPASDAWHTLTNVQFSHYTGGNRVYKSNCKTKWISYCFGKELNCKVINKR